MRCDFSGDIALARVRDESTKYVVPERVAGGGAFDAHMEGPAVAAATGAITECLAGEPSLEALGSPDNAGIPSAFGLGPVDRDQPHGAVLQHGCRGAGAREQRLRDDREHRVDPIPDGCGRTPYVAAKYDVAGLTKAASLDLVSRGIRVNGARSATCGTVAISPPGRDPG